VQRNANNFFIKSISRHGTKKAHRSCHVSEGIPFNLIVSARLQINKEVDTGFLPAYDVPIPFKLTAKGYRLLRERNARKSRNVRKRAARQMT
jgi:hypothetical protein